MCAAIDTLYIRLGIVCPCGEFVLCCMWWLTECYELGMLLIFVTTRHLGHAFMCIRSCCLGVQP